MHRIVIVGGGAGGLELATRLGRSWGKKGRNVKARVTLVDIDPTHVWKPLLHEVASGSLNTAMHQLDYAAQAKWCGFDFQQGALKRLNREERHIVIGPVVDEAGFEFLPTRTLPYDTLVLAIGSVTNFFNVPGADQYSFSIDNPRQAERFRRRLIGICLSTQHDAVKKPVRITVVGGGATGVELVAELRRSTETLGAYGLHNLEADRDIRMTLIEAAPQILPSLSVKTAQTTLSLLNKLAIDVKVNASVIAVTEEAVILKGEGRLPSDLTIWAAGIQAPPILADLDGLTTNKQNQIVVSATLESISDTNIFALGDCASCPWVGKEGMAVPPRAQAAHQQAGFLLKQCKQRLNGKPVTQPFYYRDFGALVSLGGVYAVGNLHDGVTKHGVLVRGWVARWMYGALYRLHIAALHGWISMVLSSVGQWLSGSTKPRIKLH